VAGSCEPSIESMGSIQVKSTYTLQEDTKGYRQRTISTSALDASAAAAQGKNPTTHLYGSWVDARVGLDASELRKSPPTGIRTVVQKMSLLPLPPFPAQSMRMIPTTDVP
jgi:hypothetical protein